MTYWNTQSSFQDNSLEFEKRRNIPVKYNRELWQKTGNVSSYLSYLLVMTVFCQLTSELKSFFYFYSGSHEEGGRNKTETTGQIYHEQVSKSFFGHPPNSFFYATLNCLMFLRWGSVLSMLTMH